MPKESWVTEIRETNSTRPYDTLDALQYEDEDQLDDHSRGDSRAETDTPGYSSYGSCLPTRTCEDDNE